MIKGCDGLLTYSQESHLRRLFGKIEEHFGWSACAADFPLMNESKTVRANVTPSSEVTVLKKIGTLKINKAAGSYGTSPTLFKNCGDTFSITFNKMTSRSGKSCKCESMFV